MCLIVFAWDCHPKYKLIVAANRDEFYERPTSQAQFWDDKPMIFGGRDLQAKGTWMAISKNGKFGALTNFRNPQDMRPDARSRGEIIPSYLESDKEPEAYINELHGMSEDFNGFNFLAGDYNQLVHYSNAERKMNLVTPGIHGLSNALLDTDWPKVTKLKERFSQAIADDFSHDDLLGLLRDKSISEEDILPDTGVSREWERALSPICIQTETYGTSIATALTIDRFGNVAFTEKTLPVGGREANTINFDFKTDFK